MKDSLKRSIFKSLLGKGFFPKELPPVFTTTSFGQDAIEILEEWEKTNVFSVKPAKKFPKVDGKVLRGRYSYSGLPEADPEIISKPKKLYERRNVHIAHPVPQALLAKEMSWNWMPIQKWLSRQSFSEDEIIVAEKFDRAIKGINFQAHRAKKSFLEASSDWLVKTDITRFYPTIYTHSIAWAAYGKERVKSNRKYYDGSVADRLDQLVRSCNRNQTIGIPIGPETSRIIAEIISSRIDADYLKDYPNSSQLSVDRLQDDWTVGTNSLESAEKILSVIAKCYKTYGLEINGSKTSVTHILSTKQRDWKSEISAFLSHKKGALSRSRLSEFLSLSLRLQLDSPSDPVLSYSLSIVEGMTIEKFDLEVVESFLLRATAVAPISLDRICRIILNLEHKTGALSKKRLSTRFLSLAERHFENGALFEVIWLLYTLRGLKIQFCSKRLMDLAEDVQSSAVRLLLLDMHRLNLCIKKPPLSLWASQISVEKASTDWSWLYSYEAVRKGWLAGPANFLNCPFLKPMHIRNVEFYNPKKNVSTSVSFKRRTAAVRKKQTTEVRRILLALRAFNSKDVALSDY